MKPFYICNACFHFTRKNEDHYIGVLGKTRCAGELKQAFCSKDLLEEIEELEKQVHYKDGTVVYPDKYISTLLANKIKEFK